MGAVPIRAGGVLPVWRGLWGMAMGNQQGWMKAVIGLMSVLLSLSACTTVSHQSVAPSPQVRSYELRGPRLDVVQAEAQRLCQQGFDVHRQSGHSERLVGEPQKPANYLALAWNHAIDWMDKDTDRAQMAISCK